jgi:sulfur relay (sulfurtransferase) complex TusBCD TusD component (DsrE family)
MLRKLFLLLAFVGAIAAMPVAADSHGSLFVNLTTDETHRADMALVFSKAMIERGHPVTIWLNDRAVFLGSRQNSATFAEQQKSLTDLMGKGATVIACPFCLKHYAVEPGTLLDGVKVGNPDMTSAILFKDDTKTLTW